MQGKGEETAHSLDGICGMHRSSFVEEEEVRVSCGILRRLNLFMLNTDWKTSFTGILILMLQLVMITLIKLKCSNNFEAITADQNGGRMVMM